MLDFGKHLSQTGKINPRRENYKFARAVCTRSRSPRPPPIFPKVVYPPNSAVAEPHFRQCLRADAIPFGKLFVASPNCRSVGGQTWVTVGPNSAVAEPHFWQRLRATAPPFGKLFVIPPHLLVCRGTDQGDRGAEFRNSRTAPPAVSPGLCATFREVCLEVRGEPVTFPQVIAAFFCWSVGGQTKGGGFLQ